MLKSKYFVGVYTHVMVLPVTFSILYYFSILLHNDKYILALIHIKVSL